MLPPAMSMSVVYVCALFVFDYFVQCSSSFSAFHARCRRATVSAVLFCFAICKALHCLTDAPAITNSRLQEKEREKRLSVLNTVLLNKRCLAHRAAGAAAQYESVRKSSRARGRCSHLRQCGLLQRHVPSNCAQWHHARECMQASKPFVRSRPPANR
jgi:hypothetical protein